MNKKQWIILISIAVIFLCLGFLIKFVFLKDKPATIELEDNKINKTFESAGFDDVGKYTISGRFIDISGKKLSILLSSIDGSHDVKKFDKKYILSDDFKVYAKIKKTEDDKYGDNNEKIKALESEMKSLGRGDRERITLLNKEILSLKSNSVKGGDLYLVAEALAKETDEVARKELNLKIKAHLAEYKLIQVSAADLKEGDMIQLYSDDDFVKNNESIILKIVINR